jgi:hypothetical protein
VTIRRLFIEISSFGNGKSYFDVPDLRRSSLETFVSHKLLQKPADNSLEKLSVLALQRNLKPEGHAE